MTRWSVSLCCENVSPDFQTSASRSAKMLTSVWLPSPPPARPLEAAERAGAERLGAGRAGAGDVAGNNRPRLLRREQFLLRTLQPEREERRGDAAAGPPHARVYESSLLRPWG